MQPINYMIEGTKPVEDLMSGVAQGLGLQKEAEMRANRAAAQGRAANGEMRAQENHEAAKAARAAAAQKAAAAESEKVKQVARQEAFKADLGTLYKKDATVDDYLAIGAKYPEFGDALNETWSTLSETRKTGVTTRLMQIGAAIKSGNVDLAIELSNEYADAAENSGDMASAQIARGMAEVVKMDPDAAMTSLGLTLSAIDPQAAEKLFGEGARVQSSKIVGNGRVTVQNMSDGTVKVIDTTTSEELQGEAAREAIANAEASEVDLTGAKSGARESEKLDAQIEGGGKAKASEALGSLQAKFVDKAQVAIGSVSSTIRNMTRAISAIDDGGRSGAIDKLMPNITEASAELANSLNGLGLNVVGSVTFGALSEGELKLAMDVAAPRDLDEVPLREWLVKRRDAQEKVATALEEQARFLSDPNNTLQDWYDKVYAQKQESEASTATDRGRMGLPDRATDEDVARYRELARKITKQGYRPTPDEADFLRSMAK